MKDKKYNCYFEMTLDVMETHNTLLYKFKWNSKI